MLDVFPNKNEMIEVKFTHITITIFNGVVQHIPAPNFRSAVNHCQVSTFIWPAWVVQPLIEIMMSRQNTAVNVP
jgi:hypothetical protein